MPAPPHFHCPEVQSHCAVPMRDIHVQEVLPVHVPPFFGIAASHAAAGPFTQWAFLESVPTQCPPMLLHVEIVCTLPFAVHVVGPSSGQ